MNLNNVLSTEEKAALVAIGAIIFAVGVMVGMMVAKWAF